MKILPYSFQNKGCHYKIKKTPINTHVFSRPPLRGASNPRLAETLANPLVLCRDCFVPRNDALRETTFIKNTHKYPCAFLGKRQLRTLAVLNCLQ